MRGRRKSPPTFHSGESRNLILATARIFREAKHCNSRLWRMRLCRRDSGFRRNGSSFNFAVPPPSHSRESENLPPLSIPAKAGISFSQQREFSAKRNIATVAFGECGFAAEIPAFAGMEVLLISPSLPPPIPAKAKISPPLSIPAKAGISFSRQREFSAKRNIATVAFGECGFAAEIPAFAGMEVLLISPSLPLSHSRESENLPLRLPFRRKPESHSRDSENFPRSGTLQWSPSANAASPQRFRLSPEWKFFEFHHPSPSPIPAKAGISLSSNCFGARCQKTVRDSGRFPLSREWK